MQAGAGGKQGRRSGADGLADLADVDALQVAGRDPEVRLTEPVLNDVERHARGRTRLRAHAEADGVRIAVAYPR